MPAMHSPRPIRPAMGRPSRDSPGLSLRVTAISAPRRNTSGAPTGAPRKAIRSLLSWPTVVDGLQNGIGIGTAAVGPFDRLCPEGSGADLARHEVGSVEADSRGAVRDLGSDLELVGAGIPVGGGLRVG